MGQPTLSRIRQFGPGDAETFGIYTGPDRVADKVIATGDSLFGSTVTDLAFDRDGMNNKGQIAFTAHLADGRGRRGYAPDAVWCL